MILITGSSGMVGTALAEKLELENIDYLGLDRRPNNWNEKVQAKTINFDLLNPLTEELLNKCRQSDIDFIVHLAANARVYDLIKDPNLAVENAISTNKVYLLARELDAKKVIFASSREVYGEILSAEQAGSVTEDMSNHLNCTNQYTASKLFGESLAQSYRKTDKIETIVVRLSNVYGRYDTSGRYVPLVIKKIIDNEVLQIFGGKDKAMDFTYLDDTVRGIKLIIDKFDSLSAQPGLESVFNISSGQVSTLYEVAQKLMKLMNKEIQVDLVDNRPGEPMYYRADISKIAKLGYQPQFNIDQGLERAVEYYKEVYQ